MNRFLHSVGGVKQEFCFTGTPKKHMKIKFNLFKAVVNWMHGRTSVKGYEPLSIRLIIKILSEEFLQFAHLFSFLCY